MEFLMSLLGIAAFLLIGIAIVLGLALLCLWEARQIVRLTSELLRLGTPASRATCDR
jgi:hypothetical protein